MANCHANRTKWTASVWELGWETALKRIDGLPPELARCPHIQKSLGALDEAVIDGDSMRFQRALIVLTDGCAESINRGDHKQWW